MAYHSTPYRLVAILAAVMLAVFLAGCSPAGPPAAQPTALASSAPPATATEPPPAPQRTFAVVATLAPPETVIEKNKATTTQTAKETMNPSPGKPYETNLVGQARQDLAARLNVPPEKIEFLSFEEVIWPDGSLGCPKPGMAYIQIMVEGYRILLRYEGQVYAYHGGGNRPPFLCQNPQQQP